MFKPTPEQDAITQAVRENNNSLMIQAMAGCAKTTTLELISKITPMRPSLALAFNVKIKKELERRFPKHFTIMTMNGLGHRAWGKAIGKQPIVEPSKLFKTLKKLFEDERVPSDADVWGTVHTLVKGARHAGLIPEQYHEQFHPILSDDYATWESIADLYYLDISDNIVFLARRALVSLIKQSFQGVIDYDDQIYMSCLFGGTFPKFAIVMVDEAQDLSPLNHIQVKRTAVDRLIVVGDPRQAIYAFRGADSSSMDTMRELRPTWQELQLSTTFRCPRILVERQQSHAPGFTAAPSNLEGEFHDWTQKEAWGISDVERAYPNKNIAILCRNNAPIISSALRIIRSGRGVTVLGSEIGKSLVTLSKKILPNDDTTAEDCYRKIFDWAQTEIDKARANEKEERIAIIQDKSACLTAVLDSGKAKSAGNLREILGTMFAKENLRITLSTGHKAKGLEWPVVVHLDPFRIPSKYAKAAASQGHMIPLEQDMNLKYVIETRAQEVLIEANLDNMISEEEDATSERRATSVDDSVVRGYLGSGSDRVS